jgi:hypothetical protein
VSPFSCPETLLAWYDIKKVIRLWVFVGSHITSPFKIAVGRYSRGAAPQKAQWGTDWVVELETKLQLFVSRRFCFFAIDDFRQFVAVTGLLVRYCVQRASVLPNTPLSSMMKGSFVVAPRVLAKLELAAGLRRGHRSRQAAQDCGVIHCAGLPPPLCGAATSPLSRDESARARRRGAGELHKWCLSAAVLSPRPSVDGARRGQQAFERWREL